MNIQSNYDAYTAPPFPVTIDKEIPFGTVSDAVKLVQECLTYHGHATSPDKDFGPATRAALRSAGYGGITPAAYAALVSPLACAASARWARDRNDIPDQPIGDMVVSVARNHLRFIPTEIGGQNRGPWVRLYCRGHDGVNYPWCAAFVSYVVYQAAWLTGRDGCKMPYTLSCDHLFDAARDAHLLKDTPKPGDVFLLRKGNDRFHAGIVVHVSPDVIKTIEGNTNDDGSREGYKVCTRFRAIRNMDFVRPF